MISQLQDTVVVTEWIEYIIKKLKKDRYSTGNDLYIEYHHEKLQTYQKGESFEIVFYDGSYNVEWESFSRDKLESLIGQDFAGTI